VNRIDIAVLVEKWLHAGIYDNLVAIAKYFTLRRDRNDGRSGRGVLVCVRNGLPCEPLSQLDNSDFPVSRWLSLTSQDFPASHCLSLTSQTSL